MNVHVWVDETRPRNQGAFLTAWELKQQGVSHTVIPDNTGFSRPSPWLCRPSSPLSQL